MTEPLPIPAAAVPPTEVAARLERHARHARGALAPATARALRDGSAAFGRWCDRRGVPALPAAAEVVAEYVDDLAARGRKPAGIRQAVWAVGYLHRAAHLPDPTKAAPVGLALRRMARRLGGRQRQAAPVGEAEAAAMVATAGTGLAARRDAALVLVMRDLLARRSEAVALAVADLDFAPDGSATALIRRGKTDQGGRGETRWLAPRTVAHLRRWLDAAGIAAGPVFRPVNKAGRPGDGALGGGDVPRILKRLAARAGLDPAAVSGHSCRVGMCQDLVAAGAELPAVMQAGRWRSPAMPARYAERLLAGRGAVARYYERRGG